MISILEQKRKYVRMSLHRMFLFASAPVLKALVLFMENRKDRSSSALLQDYINQNLPKFNYEKKCDLSKLISQGAVHDLKSLYDQMNETYFNSSLDLNITWYGADRKKRGHQITYGLYNDPLKLIKIHRLLDRKVCPEFYVAFVVYHEMIHAVHRPQRGEKRTRIHTKEFRAQEKLFHDYEKAINWEKKSRHLFFK